MKKILEKETKIKLLEDHEALHCVENNLIECINYSSKYNNVHSKYTSILLYLRLYQR